MTTPFLELQKIDKIFKNQSILKSVSLQIPEGEFLVLLGPSGCGKSTLLRVMAGLEEPTQGRLLWPKNNPSEEKAPSFGFVFQEAQLLPWRTSLENARLPLELQKLGPRAEQNRKAQQALEKVGLGENSHLFPHELSGGMRMRVSIARALSARAKILFLDEPFAALDEVTRFELQNQLRRLSESEGLTLVFITHSTYEAAFLADRILMMGPREGRFILDQKVSYQHPRNDLLREQGEYQNQVQTLQKVLREAF